MRRMRIVGVYVLTAIIGWPLSALAVTPGDPSFKSTNYSINESYIGPGGDSQGISTNYKTQGSTLGDTGVGNSASTNFQSTSGYDTDHEPALTFVLNTTNVNLGVLSTGAKSTGIATFSVKDYVAFGYAVYIVGSSPTYGGHPLTTLATDTASSAGTEQFGVNTVRNTVAVVGADPVQVPSSFFSFGVAGDGATGTYGTTRPYTIPDKWRYVSGDTVASGAKSSGETDYTMTFMANMSPLTPAGTYASNISIVVTGTY